VDRCSGGFCPADLSLSFFNSPTPPFSAAQKAAQLGFSRRPLFPRDSYYRFRGSWKFIHVRHIVHEQNLGCFPLDKMPCASGHSSGCYCPVLSRRPWFSPLFFFFSNDRNMARGFCPVNFSYTARPSSLKTLLPELISYPSILPEQRTTVLNTCPTVIISLFSRLYLFSDMSQGYASRNCHGRFFFRYAFAGCKFPPHLVPLVFWRTVTTPPFSPATSGKDISLVRPCAGSRHGCTVAKSIGHLVLLTRSWSLLKPGQPLPFGSCQVSLR